MRKGCIAKKSSPSLPLGSLCVPGCPHGLQATWLLLVIMVIHEIPGQLEHTRTARTRGDEDGRPSKVALPPLPPRH